MPVVPVVPGVHAIESVLGTRRLAQWLAIGSDGALLVDTGVAGTVREHVEPALRELGLTPDRITDVAITHADVDHYGGDAEIRTLAPDARLRAHALDRPLIECWDVIARERYGWYRGHGLDYDAPTLDWLADAAGPDTPLDGELGAGERIDLGGLALEVLHLPGHSLGHVGFHEPSTRTAIVGDAVMGRGFERADGGGRAGPPPYVGVAAYRATIAQLRELAPARLCTSHFPVFEGDAVAAFLDLSAAFVDDLDRAIGDAGGGADVAALLDPVAAALGGFDEMPVELARSIGAHLSER